MPLSLHFKKNQNQDIQKAFGNKYQNCGEVLLYFKLIKKKDLKLPLCYQFFYVLDMSFLALRERFWFLGTNIHPWILLKSNPRPVGMRGILGRKTSSPL